MSRRVFVDFHHSSLLRSLVLLFEGRLGMEVYRPIGMDWFEEGFWAINNQRETAEQFLSLDQALRPADGTPHLNEVSPAEFGTYKCADAGGQTFHKACTLDWFKNNEFDFVVASIPAHVNLFKKLIKLYNPKAKLIIQMGNNWKFDDYQNENILASIAPQPGGYQCNVMFYHQEFDLSIFHPSEVVPSKQVYSFVNVIENMPSAWTDFKLLEAATSSQGFVWKSYGGQCRDGNMNGPIELAAKMREAMLIFHVKPGGDGYGHIIHNAYASGRPVIARSSQYAGQLASELLVPGTFIDLDQYDLGEAKNFIIRLADSPDQVAEMGAAASRRFTEVVDFIQESKEIWQWLETF